MGIYSWVKSNKLSTLVIGLLLGLVLSLSFFLWKTIQKTSMAPAPGVIRTIADAPETEITPPPSVTIKPRRTTPTPTVTAISPCKTGTFYTSTEDEVVQKCQIVELRTRDLLQATYNLHNILIEVQDGLIERSGPLNKINDLNNDLTGLWLRIAGFGLGTDPYLGYHINVGYSGFSDAFPSPNYGIGNGFKDIGIPRLYENILSYTSLTDVEKLNKKTKFLVLIQPYSNPAVYPHKEFYERAYRFYREGKLLDIPQFTEDLETLEKWLTDLENVLSQIPGFLKL